MIKSEMKKLPLVAKQGLVLGTLTRYCREYGTIRVARLDSDGVDTLVLFSPPMVVPGDVSTVAVTVLDGPLYDLMVSAYGTIADAARAFGLARTSCHFTESEQEG